MPNHRTSGTWFKTRSEKILALVPRCGIDSDGGPDTEDEFEDEKRISVNFEVEPLELEEGEYDLPVLNLEEATQQVVDLCGIPGPSNNPPTPTPGPSNHPPTPGSSNHPLTPGSSNHSPTPGSSREPLTPATVKRGKKRSLSMQPQQNKRVKFKTKPLKVKWKRSKFRSSVTIPPGPFENVVVEDDATTRTPLSYFLDFFSEECVDLIVEQTNLYSLQQTGNSLNIDRNTVKAFIGIEIYMGIIDLPAMTDYWSARFRQALVADVMSLKQFQKMRRFIHFANNGEKDDDPFFNIRPLAELIRQNCLKIPPEGQYSVDEMMVPYKRAKAGSKKQYMPKKPCKWGYKLFVRAGISGMVYDFLLYCGNSTFHNVNFSPKEEAMLFSSKVVVALTKSIQEPALSTIFCDNFFTSLELIVYLRRELGILSLGTIRANRTLGAPITPEKQVNRQTRGWFEELVDNKNKIALVQWLDSKPVLLASTYVSLEPVGSIERWSKAASTYLDVPCPKIISEYNIHMGGGVDLADMLIALFRTPFRSHRWYTPFLAQLIDICVNNAWLMYRRDVAKIRKPEKKTNSGKQNKSKKRKAGEKSIQKQSEEKQNETSTDQEQGKNSRDQERSGRERKHLEKETEKKKKKTTKKKNPDGGMSELPLKEFRADVAEQLIRYAVRAKNGDPSPLIRKKTAKKSQPQNDPHPLEHLPTFTGKGKCRYCHNQQTMVFCAKCQMRLCLVPPRRNCFLEHHLHNDLIVPENS